VYREKVDSLKLYLNPRHDIFARFERWESDTVIALTPHGDGTWRCEVPVRSGKLAYQIAGIEQSGQRVPDPTAGQYEYDGGRSYRSVVYPEGERWLVSIDPRRFPRQRAGKDSLWASHPVTRAVADAFELWTQLDAVGDALQRKSLSLPEGVRDDSLAVWIQREIVQPLEQAILREAIPEARQVLLRLYASVVAYSLLNPQVQVNDTLVHRILREVPPTSVLWGVKEPPGVVVVPVFRLHPPATEYIEEMLRAHPNREVRKAVFRDVQEYASFVLDTAVLQWVDQLRKVVDAGDTTRGALRPGMVAPGFVVLSLEDSSTVADTNFRGRYLLLDFWATWCTPCIQEFPTLRKAYEQYRAEGFEILGISLDREFSRARAFWQRRSADMPWKQAWAGAKSPVARAFGVQSIPFPVLLDPDGRIVAWGASLRGKSLLQMLSRVFSRGQQR